MCVRLLLSSLLLWMTGSSPSYPSTCLGGKWELHLPVQAITGAILSDSILSCFSVWLIIISTISVYGFATHHLNLLKGGVCVSCNFLCLQPILHPGFFNLHSTWFISSLWRPFPIPCHKSTSMVHVFAAILFMSRELVFFNTYAKCCYMLWVNGMDIWCYRVATRYGCSTTWAKYALGMDKERLIYV